MKEGCGSMQSGLQKSKGRHDVPSEKSSTCQTLFGLRSLVLLLPRFSLVSSAGSFRVPSRQRQACRPFLLTLTESLFTLIKEMSNVANL
ncbi:unnamed protein product [Sphagnum balticum]